MALAGPTAVWVASGQREARPLVNKSSSQKKTFQGVIDLHLNTFFKKRTFMMNYKNRHPWMTEVLRNKIKSKNQLHSIAISSHDDQIMQEYKEAKKILHSSLRNACISHFGDQLEINKNDLFKT